MPSRTKCAAVLAVLGTVCFGAAPMKAAPIGGGDILVEQSGPTGVGGDTNAAAFLVLDVNPTTSSVVQSFVSTQFSSAGKMYTTTQQPLENLSLSDGGTEVSFAGWDSPGTASPLGTTQGIPLGVGTLDASGAGGMPASYNPAVLNPSPDQPHTAYSPDGVNWYFGDTDGMYYNNGTTPLAGSNGTIAIKGFGGNTYALHTIRPSIMPDQENTVGGDRISLVTPATPGTGSITHTTILTKETPGLVIHDFYMLSSGNNSVYDTMYVTTSSGVDKYALISGTWTAEGSAALAGASGIAAKELAGGGVSLFVSADGNSATLDELTDSAAFNATINASTPLVLYTAPTDDLLHGVSLARTGEFGTGDAGRVRAACAGTDGRLVRGLRRCLVNEGCAQIAAGAMLLLDSQFGPWYLARGPGMSTENFLGACCAWPLRSRPNF